MPLERTEQELYSYESRYMSSGNVGPCITVFIQALCWLYKSSQNCLHKTKTCKLVLQKSEEELRLVVVHLVVYVYDCQANTFKAVPDMPSELPQQLQLAFQALQDVAAG